MNPAATCEWIGCNRGLPDEELEPVTLGLTNSETGESSDQTTYMVCAEHRDYLVMRVLTVGQPPADEAAA